MSNNNETCVLECAKLLAEHNGGDTLVMDLRGLSSWTDFFVVCSATSSTHLRGLARRAEDFLRQTEFPPLRSPRLSDDDMWCLIDCGVLLVHIMTSEARVFYELEKLWFESKITRIAASGENSLPRDDEPRAAFTP